MAWCETCAEPVEDERTVRDEQGIEHCPHCNSVVAPGEGDDAPPKAPWHFKVLALGTVGYLVYRLIWFIFWLRHHA
ncbi:MAG TPA: hypothetical protein VNF07_00890 [Acidimicrobiales bacterium]|nr:hypothetical protein [Acidimicrobiales bacterium]